jgi:hypothetical protein
LTYDCPFCAHHFAAADLQQPAGATGGTYCPKCQERVRISFPYAGRVVAASLFLAAGILWAFQVRSLVWLATGTALLWVPISLFLNVYMARFKPPTLKKWKERTHKTFFEWLYERDRIRAPRISDQDK